MIFRNGPQGAQTDNLFTSFKRTAAAAVYLSTYEDEGKAATTMSASAAIYSITAKGGLHSHNAWWEIACMLLRYPETAVPTSIEHGARAYNQKLSIM